MKIFNIIIIIATAVVLSQFVSCQQINEVQGNKEDLTQILLIASCDNIDTKVSYSEMDGGSKLHPIWQINDKVIGFDSDNNTYTFTVTDIYDGIVTLTGEAPFKCSLHLIYLSAVDATSIIDGNLAVNYNNQPGDNTTPAVMLADVDVNNGSGNAVFKNAGAVIGIDRVKGLPKDAVVSKITIKGDNLSTGNIALDGNKLKLSAENNEDESIATGTEFSRTTVALDGYLSEKVLFAVPSGSIVKGIIVTAGSEDYEYTLPEPLKAFANCYYSLYSSHSFPDSGDVSMKFTTSKAAHGKVSVSVGGATESTGTDGHFEAACSCVAGSKIVLEAVPDEGYEFVKWIDKAGNEYYANPLPYTVPGYDSVVKAFFVNRAIKDNGEMINGCFSVGEDEDGIVDLVVFSKGNLQAYNLQGKDKNPSGNYYNYEAEWRFAEKQYDIVGESDNIHFYNGDVDNIVAVDLHKLDSSGSSPIPLYYYSFESWGKLFPDTDWRMVGPCKSEGETVSEYEYILNRQDKTKFFTGEIEGGHKGIFLLPDNFDWKMAGLECITLDRTHVIGDYFNFHFCKDVISSDVFSKLEQSGVVFLPNSGYISRFYYSYNSYYLTSDPNLTTIFLSEEDYDGIRAEIDICSCDPNDFASIRLVSDL